MRIPMEIDGRLYDFDSDAIGHQSGVYLVVARPHSASAGLRILYVGEAGDIQDRLNSHDSEMIDCWNKNKENGLMYLAHHCDQAKREWLEAKIITKYRADLPCNTQGKKLTSILNS